MKISTILDHIDSGHMALPEFQRGYVWNRDQVRALFDSLYRRHPVGTLLVWATEAKRTKQRGSTESAPGIVKLLLDGQQRITTLYGVIRGKPPQFFDGNKQVFTGLYFHLEDESFAFYQPLKMQEDPLWVSVTTLMAKGISGLGDYVQSLGHHPNVGLYVGKLSQLLGITEIDLHVEEVTGVDKTLDVVVDIFNKVNSGGTKLSKGDLALAKICADWPEARDTLKKDLHKWKINGYNFSMDWLLRSLNTVLTGEARFSFLHDKTAEEVRDGLNRACKAVDTALNMISGRLGLDHDTVLFGRYAIPVMVRYLDQWGSHLDAKTRDKLLFWYVQAGMWGRFSGSTESVIDQDLAILDAGGKDGVDNLLEQLRLWHGSLLVQPEHFAGWSVGARFYSVLYLLSRMGEAKDWGTGLPLKQNLLGRGSQLEVHHIFPKAQLYRRKRARSEVNSLANFCFLTKDTNLKIRDRLPAEYFEEVEENHPGALASQWIPGDRNLWKVENYPYFLEARRELLAEEANRYLAKLLHGETHWLQRGIDPILTQAPAVISVATNNDEEVELEQLNAWVIALNLPAGQLAFEYTEDSTGNIAATFDLAWPYGLQEQLSTPVAVLLNEEASTIAFASSVGYKCFTQVADFKRYVLQEILGDEAFVADGTSDS